MKANCAKCYLKLLLLQKLPCVSDYVGGREHCPHSALFDDAHVLPGAGVGAILTYDGHRVLNDDTVIDCYTLRTTTVTDNEFALFVGCENPIIRSARIIASREPEEPIFLEPYGKNAYLKVEGKGRSYSEYKIQIYWG